MDDVSSIVAFIAPKVSNDGAAFLSGERLRPLLPPLEFSELVDSWGHLEQDGYLPGEVTYRKRRYGRLLANPGPVDYIFTPLRSTTFQQPADLIPLYGGRPRTFAPIGEDVLISPALLALLRLDLAIITAAERSRNVFAVGLHMIRIVAHPGLCQLPAPEGRHSDGHCYVAMHLIRRQGCEGGTSLVFLPGATEPIVETTLTESLDSLVVDDRQVEHSVTAVEGLEYEGTRDMLLIDFDLAKEPPSA